jgi:hypothetical protein
VIVQVERDGYAGSGGGNKRRTYEGQNTAPHLSLLVGSGAITLTATHNRSTALVTGPIFRGHREIILAILGDRLHRIPDTWVVAQR